MGYASGTERRGVFDYVWIRSQSVISPIALRLQRSKSRGRTMITCSSGTRLKLVDEHPVIGMGNNAG